MKELVGITLSYSDGSEVIILPDGERFAVVHPKPADPAPARLQKTREKLEKEAPEVAAAAEVQAGPPPGEKPTPEMRQALRQAWLDEGGNPDDTREMWARLNSVLNRKPGDTTPFTAVEIGRLMERRKLWSPKRRAALVDAPTEPPRGLEAS